MTNHPDEPSPRVPPSSEGHPPDGADVEAEKPQADPIAVGLPETEHSAAEHAFPTEHPLEKWINEAHG